MWFDEACEDRTVANTSGEYEVAFTRGVLRQIRSYVLRLGQRSQSGLTSGRRSLLVFDIELIHDLFDVGNSGNELFDLCASRLRSYVSA